MTDQNDVQLLFYAIRIMILVEDTHISMNI